MTWIMELILLVYLVSVHGVVLKKPHSIRASKHVYSEPLDDSTEMYKLPTRPGVSVPVIPEACKHRGICDTVPNYPMDIVKQLIQQASANGTQFNQDTLQVPDQAARASEHPEDIDLCASIDRVFAPRAALNVKNEWNYILNDSPNPIQTFRMQFCNQINAPCLGMAAFNMGYKSRCIQKIYFKKMIAFKERSEIFQADFKVPSSCSCMLQQAYI